MEPIVITTTEKIQEIVTEVVRAEFTLHFDQLIKQRNEISEEYLTFKQMQLMLKISRPTLFKRMKDGTIEFRKVGRRLLFPKQKVIMSINKHKQ